MYPANYVVIEARTDSGLNVVPVLGLQRDLCLTAKMKRLSASNNKLSCRSPVNEPKEIY